MINYLINEMFCDEEVFDVDAVNHPVKNSLNFRHPSTGGELQDLRL